MKKYMQIEIKVDGISHYMEMPLESFCQESNIDIISDIEMVDSDEFTNKDVDDFTNEEIGDFAIDQYDNVRYEMGIDVDSKIRYIGFRVLDEGHEELMSGE